MVRRILELGMAIPFLFTAAQPVSACPSAGWEVFAVIPLAIVAFPMFLVGFWIYRLTRPVRVVRKEPVDGWTSIDEAFDDFLSRPIPMG